MSDQPKVEIAVAVNADPAKAGLADLNAAFQATGAAGAKAGDAATSGFDKIAASAKSNATKLQTALDSVERASVAATTGGASSPDSFATRFKQRKIEAEALTASLAKYAETLAAVQAKEAATKVATATQSALNSIDKASATLAGGGRGTAPDILALAAKQAGADMAVVNAALRTYSHELSVAVTASDALAASIAKQAATQSALNSIERAKLAGAAAGGVGKPADLLGLSAKQTGADMAVVNAALAKYSAEMAAAKTATEAAALASLEMNKGVLGTFTTAKGLNAALRQVPAQLTDIVVSLQGGQAPLTVLLQQGGQLKDVFGGIIPAAKALGGYILGLVNPYTLLAAAVAAVGFVYYKASAQVEAFSNALILSGRAAGSTANELEDIAFSLSKISKVSLGTSAAALTEFVASGRFGAQNIQLLTQAAIELEKRGGPAVKATRDEFIALAKDPLVASLRLNESINYLTRSLADQIRALEENGHAVKAGELAQKAYADAILSRATEIKDNLGIFKRLFKGIAEEAANAGSAVIKAMDDFGKVRTPEQRIKELQNLKAGSHIGTSTADINNEIAQQQELLSLNKKASAAADAAAAAKDREAKATQRRNVFVAEQIKNESADQKLAREIKEARGRNADDIRDKIITPKEGDALIAAIRLRNAKTGQENQAAKAAADYEVAVVQKGLERQIGLYAGYQKNYDALRAAGKISDAEYYTSRHENLNDLANLERSALDAELKAEQKRKIFGKTKDERDTAEFDKKKKLLEIQSRIDKLTDTNDATRKTLVTEEQEAIEKRTRAIKEAANAQEDYIQTTIRGYAREIVALDKGDKERARLAKVNSIEDKFAGERKTLERTKILDPKGDTSERKDFYAEQEVNLARSLQRELALYSDHYADLLRKEKDWAVGAGRALKQYQEQAANVANTTENFFTGAFKGMEDALVTFVTTGKLSFASLADYIVAEIARIIIKQQLSNALGVAGTSAGGSGFLGGAASIFSALMGSGGTTANPVISNLGADMPISGFATGGYAEAGSLHQVNENGPELLTTGGSTYLMMGAQGGTVTPNSAIGGNTVNVTVNQSFGAGTSRATTLQAAADASRQLTAAGRNL